MNNITFVYKNFPRENGREHEDAKGSNWKRLEMREGAGESRKKRGLSCRMSCDAYLVTGAVFSKAA